VKVNHVFLPKPLKEKSKVLSISYQKTKVYGKDVRANAEIPLELDPAHPGKNTVTYEARYLKWLLLKITTQ
jgi:hypothetical protein